jgi:hypothetical protein
MPTMSDNPLGAMFEWWNEAYRQADGFTPEAFGRWFTSDATLRVNGAERATGPEALARHFRNVQSTTDAVVLERPPLAEFVSADGTQACSHHFVTARAGGRVECERVIAVARLDCGRIAALDVVGVPTTR